MNKNVFVLMFFALIFSNVKSQTANQSAHSTVDQLKWLEGTWTRTNSKAGQSGIEMWKKVSSTELSGRGVAMQGSDTVFVEKLRIIVRDGNLFYVADVPENQNPVFFRLTEIKKNSFTCENPDHDFPKKIAYNLQGNKLQAKISGDGKVIDYLFERTDKK
jgi:hypothetical protein